MVRFETALDYLNAVNDMCESKGLDFFAEIQKQFAKCTVSTRYNNKCYEVSGIDFTLTPMSKFPFADQTLTLVDYYKAKYDEEIKNLN